MLRQIQTAIDQLPRKEFWKLEKWFIKRKNEVWDQEMEEDARPGGPLDKLFKEALEEHKAGLTIPLEEVLRSPRKAGRQTSSSKGNAKRRR